MEIYSGISSVVTCTQCDHKFDIHTLLGDHFPKILRSLHLHRFSCVPLVKAERNDAETLLATAKDVMAKIDDQLCALDNMVASLKKERQRVLKIAEIHEYVLAPIRRVPPEVLRNIFAWVFGTSVTKSRDITWQWKERANLSSVSWLWRRTIVHSPELWSTVDFSCFSATGTGALILKSWLARSGTLPLDIAMNFLVDGAGQRAQLLAALFGHSERWNSLSIPWPPSLHPDIMNNLTGQPRNLKRLAILGDPDDKNSQHRDSYQLFESAPLLSSISFHLNVPRDLALPWWQIRELTLTQLADRVDVWRLLSLLENVQSLSLDNVSCQSIRLPIQNLKLPHLTCLSVTGRYLSEPFTAHLFSRLFAPTLESLTLDKSDWGSQSCDDLLHSVTRMVQQSSCPMTNLHIRLQRFNAAVRQLLRSTPTVTHLVVDFPWLQDGITAPLSSFCPDHPGGEVLAPRLQNLTIHAANCGDAEKDGAAVCHLIESRRLAAEFPTISGTEPVTSLKKLNLHYGRCDDTNYQTLSDLNLNGIFGTDFSVSGWD